jgi:triosephosphate isomerase
LVEKQYQINMRKKIVAGNWKMNLTAKDADKLYNELSSLTDWPDEVEMMIFPPSIYIQKFLEKGSKKVKIGVQNFFQMANGAYTGEIGVEQVRDLGVNQVLIGHSERRAYFGEHAPFLKEKVDAALETMIQIVFCCGEPLDIREKEQQNAFVKQQLIDSLFHISAEQMSTMIIAYEPVWAIGTGKTATVQQAEAMHAEIRSWISEAYSERIAKEVSILYGGSCNADNANELFACENVDGGLIGGASLKAESFCAIAQSY